MAQSPACRQISTEFAGLASGNPALLRQAAGQRQHYAQVQAAMAQAGCGSSLFGVAASQCAGLRQQAATLAGSIGQLEAAGRAGGSEQRRAQLQAAYDSHGCRSVGRGENARAPAAAEQPRAQQRGVLESLFGLRQDTPVQQAMPGYATATLSPQAFESLEEEARRKRLEAQRKARLDEERGARPGGGLPVCVRTCDGFFFPVNYQGADSNYSAMCEASCPGASTELYWMRQGADITTAVSARGASYTALPAALSYQKARDAACSCKGNGQHWGPVLQKAEALIRRRGDIVVTAESSEKLSQPETFAELRGAQAAGLRKEAQLVTGSVTRNTQAIDPAPRSDSAEPSPGPAPPPFEALD